MNNVNNKLKIIFAGTPEISRQVLAKMLAHNFQVQLVLTQPDRPAGRGMKLTQSAVKQLALESGIEVFQPFSLKKDLTVLPKIRELAPDIMVVVSYGMILPEELLKVPRLGCINIHVSLLPKWRGAAPIQRAILAGDTQSGITIIQMDPGLDTGDMLMVAPIKLASDETSASLHDKLAQLGAAKIVEFLVNPTNYPPIPQPVNEISYAEKLTKDEARVQWEEPAHVIARKIRGYNPFPGAFSFLDGKLHKFWQTLLVEGEFTREPPGTIIKTSGHDLWVICGDGKVLAITELQEAGAKRKSIVQYLHGKLNLCGKQFEGE